MELQSVILMPGTTGAAAGVLVPIRLRADQRRDVFVPSTAEHDCKPGHLKF